MTKPDFLIIGAMKSGTSTLQAQLAAQPGIFMTTPKEPNFFSDDDVYANGPDWYAALFGGAKPDDLKGEASTHYTKLPTYPETLKRMKGSLTMPRLIYIVRNPIERAVSHFLHERSLGRTGADFEKTLQEQSEMIDYGRYAMQIAPFIDAFGKGNVHLTSLERMKDDPAGELCAAAAFIGYTGNAIWQTDLARQNVSAERVRPLPFQNLIIDSAPARWVRRTFVPKSIRTRIRQSRTISTRPEVSAALRHRLEQVFLQDRQDLAQLFPGHAVLTDCYPFARP